MVTDPRLLDLMQSVVGENLILLGTHFFCKYPVEEKEYFVAWYQDVTYWGLEPPLAHTAWIAIHDSDVENGCMKVIPGSHRQGQQVHETSETEGNLLSINQEIPGKFIDETQAMNLCLRAGQITIHEGLLLHASNPNLSRRRRCGLTARYIPSCVTQTRLNSYKQNWKPVLLRGRHGNDFDVRPLPFPLKP